MMPTPFCYQTSVLKLLHNNLITHSRNLEEESPYKPEISSATLGGHFEFEYEQKTQQLGATGFKTFWQLVHV